MRHLPIAGLAIALVAAPVPVAAESLKDAIAQAYSANPEIAAARAQLRQVDEGVPIAQSGMRPTVDLSGTFNQDLGEDFQDLGQVFTGGATLRQPIWEGGRVRTSVTAAEARIEAARARLRYAEIAVIVNTVTAYTDVIRSQAIVRLNEGQVSLLDEQLRASRDRFEVGDLTRTDVAQSEARLAAARADLNLVRAQATIAGEAYRRLVGHAPGKLDPLPPLPPLPRTEAQAVQEAANYNPSLLAAKLDEKALAADVRNVRASRMPSVGVQASAAYTESRGNIGPGSGFNPSIGVSAGMPIFSGGLIAAQVRQAQARQSQALEQITQTERLVTESASSNWALLNAAEAVIESSKIQISANTLAAEGVRQENLVGSRDILDVLNAEQELLNARVALVQAERERYVASFRLLESIGSIDPLLDGVGVERYDAEANARRVRQGFREFNEDPDPRTDRARNTAPLMGPQVP